MQCARTVVCGIPVRKAQDEVNGALLPDAVGQDKYNYSSSRGPPASSVLIVLLPAALASQKDRLQRFTLLRAFVSGACCSPASPVHL